MPWRERSIMEQRMEFVALARQPGANRRELCRRFGISAETGYKWLHRAKDGGPDWARDRSRRPHASPARSAAGLEAAVLAVRDRHPAWGARKIQRCLARRGVAEPPAASTVHAILVRHGRVTAPVPGAAALRFEHPAPNLLWQMDFKGHFPLRDERRCHPLTVLDDHSRYALCLEACTNEQTETVRHRLECTFRRYGLPAAFLVDNGSPWGDGPAQRWTRLGVWLLKLGIEVMHSRPYHPQSRGKNERFHRTLKAEVLALRNFRSFEEVQRAFDRWRRLYNLERPHEALGQNVPASRYRPSPRPMPETIPEPAYDTGDIVRSVGTTKSYVSFKGGLWRVPQAFVGEKVALRPLDPDGTYGVFFGAHQIATIDLNQPQADRQ
ncbi:MAG: IS481 family transposase [Rhodospirillales bacterium]|nr:IS481 family transposase [Rhodospirillales bacterium]MBI2977311.1 IS481 family transposase [Rhodospirillales bacterium]